MLYNLPKLWLIESGRTFNYATRVNQIRCPRLIIPDVLQDTKKKKKKSGAQGLTKFFLTAQYGSHYVVYTIWINILLNNIYNKD